MSIRYPLYIVNASIPIIVEMYPNPRSISLSSAKVFSRTQTLGGWVYEHFGDQPQTMTVKGRTQGIVGDFNNELAVEATLFQLQQLYRLDKRETLSLMPRFSPTSNQFTAPSSLPIRQLIGGTITPAQLRTLSQTFIYYRYDFYVGFFTKFNWSQDAESSPRNYEYEFEFLATTTGQNMLADALFIPTSVTQARIMTAIGLAASAPALVNLIRGFTTAGQDITNGLIGSERTAVGNF